MSDDEMDMAAAMGGDPMADEMSNNSVLDEQKKLNLKAVYDVPVELSIVLGSSKMSISDLLKMNQGSVLELDRKIGETVDVYINTRLVARGEVVIIEDNIGITMTEIIKIEQQNAS